MAFVTFIAVSPFSVSMEVYVPMNAATIVTLEFLIDFVILLTVLTPVEFIFIIFCMTFSLANHAFPSAGQASFFKLDSLLIRPFPTSMIWAHMQQQVRGLKFITQFAKHGFAIFHFMKAFFTFLRIVILVHTCGRGPVDFLLKFILKHWT